MIFIGITIAVTRNDGFVTAIVIAITITVAITIAVVTTRLHPSNTYSPQKRLTTLQI